MKRLFLTIIAAVTFFSASAQDCPQIANVLNRDKISLNGEWNYIVDVQEIGYYDYRIFPTKQKIFPLLPYIINNQHLTVYRFSLKK